MSFKRISVIEAQEMISSSGGEVTIVDIRDGVSYASGHIDSAINLTSDNVQKFIGEADTQLPLLVYCYHGNMSQEAAAWLAGQGFVRSFSLDGGYQAWLEAE
ncbi:MAG: thiosulfate sulfurtransferase GlpE [Gammaproteobacteria bacterium]|nr:thiosulfate sulfurtransferase GlpE [Gammaproteobacteria bacterium]